MNHEAISVCHLRETGLVWSYMFESSGLTSWTGIFPGSTSVIRFSQPKLFSLEPWLNAAPLCFVATARKPQVFRSNCFLQATKWWFVSKHFLWNTLGRGWLPSRVLENGCLYGSCLTTSRRRISRCRKTHLISSKAFSGDQWMYHGSACFHLLPPTVPRPPSTHLGGDAMGSQLRSTGDLVSTSPLAEGVQLGMLWTWGGCSHLK